MWSWLWPAKSAGHEVVLYTRQGCHLCDDAHEELRKARSRHNFTLRVVDIDGDEDLVRQYGECVPVVTIDGRLRFRGHVNPVLLARQLRARTRE